MPFCRTRQRTQSSNWNKSKYREKCEQGEANKQKAIKTARERTARTYSHGTPVFGRWRTVGLFEEAVLMHDPVSLDSLGRPAFAEHEGLLHTQAVGPASREDGLVCTCRLPVSRSRRPIGSWSVRIFPIPRAEEEPFTFPKECFAWSSQDSYVNAIVVPKVWWYHSLPSLYLTLPITFWCLLVFIKY